jgi:hypothetical protein
MVVTAVMVVVWFVAGLLSATHAAPPPSTRAH